MTEFLVAVFAFLGAAAGSVLPYLASRASTTQQRAQGRREEWGRRFTAALEALTAHNDERAAIGRALIVELLRSDLATEDDRRAATAVLDADATHLSDGRDLRRVARAGRVDSIHLMEDNGGNYEGDERS